MTLAGLAKKVDMLLAAQELNDWFPESKGEDVVGISDAVLRKMRKEVKHVKGWRYIASGKGVDSKQRAIRRHVQWSKRYINSLFTQAA